MQFPHVLLQIEIPAKSFGTYLACVRLLFVVRVHVKRQIVHLVECFVANVAFERFLAGMRQFVILVVALLVEALAAILADEWLVASVDASVRV